MGFLASYVIDPIKAFFTPRYQWHTIAGGRTTTAQEYVSEETALKYAAVWCATRLLCGTGASLPLPIYKGLEGEEREKARKHPVYRLLNRAPNPEMTAYNFRSIMWQWCVNWGNAYAEIVREGNDPEAPVMELWPIHPDRVEVCRKDDARQTLYYEVRSETNGEKEPLESWQMFHIPSIITCDGIVGRGVIENARETIGAGIGAEKHAASSFGQGNMPKAVVKTKGNWNKELRDAFREEWKSIHQGANGDSVAVLGGDSDITPLSWSAQDSQYIETRQFGVEEIARWYGIPPHLLQHLLRATFSNVEELGRSFVEYSLNPWLETWEQAIAHKLLAPDDDEYYAEHNVDALMRGNAQARASYYTQMIASAVMTRNEARKLENMPAVDGGDTFLTQGANVPLDDDGKPESDFSGNTNKATTTTDQPTDDNQDDGEDAAAMARSVSSCLNRVIEGDLQRFLTKETKAMAGFAKKNGNFLAMVNDFYASHEVLLRDELSPTFDALESCGMNPDVSAFVLDWVKSGNRLMIEASEAKQDELLASVQARIESKTWLERPKNAVERLK